MRDKDFQVGDTAHRGDLSGQPAAAHPADRQRLLIQSTAGTCSIRSAQHSKQWQASRI